MTHASRICLLVGWAVLTAAPAASAEPVHGYLRPYLGWGWSILTAPADQLSWYRFGTGVAGGVNLSGVSLGLDFNFHLGSKFQGHLAEDPTVQGDGRVHAFRLLADVGYDVSGARLTLRPHLLGGVEWRRLSLGEDLVQYRRAAVVAPSLLGLAHLKEHGHLAIGIDARWALIVLDDTLYTHLSGFFVIETKF